MNGPLPRRHFHDTIRALVSHFAANLDAFGARFPEWAGALAHASVSAPVGIVPQIPEDALRGVRLLLLVGVGDGAFFPALYRRFTPHAPYCLIVVQSWAELRQAFHQADWRPVIRDENVTWMPALAPDTAHVEFFRYFGKEPHVMAAAGICQFDAFPESASSYYEAMNHTFHDIARARCAMALGDPEDAYQGFSDTVRNRDHLCTIPCFDQLEGAFPGKPGIVIASGPSLESSIPLLRAHQDRAILYSVDSAHKYLEREGIHCHLTACVERMPGTARMFAGMPPTTDTWLVGLPLIPPETFAAFQGPQSYQVRSHAFGDWFLPGDLANATGLSSAHLAYRGLHMMGCDPIMLVGQDLAFDRASHMSHAGGADTALKHHSDTDDPIVRALAYKFTKGMVAGNDGTPIESRADWIRFLAIQGPLIANSGRRCINAIPAHMGARIEHATRMDPADAFALLGAPFDARPAIRERLMVNPAHLAARRAAWEQRTAQAHQFFTRRAIPALIDMLHQTSLFIQYHQLSSYTPAFETAFAAHCATLEQREAQLIQESEGAWGLLAHFVWAGKFKTTSRIIEAQRAPGEFISKMIPLLDAVKTYYTNILGWTVRVAGLLG